jgi:hypothetical protein
MLRIPHCLDSRLTEDGEVVSPMHLPRSTAQKHYFSVSGIHFCYRPREPQSLLRPEGLGKLKKCIYLIGCRIRDLPACSVVPQPLRFCVLHYCYCSRSKQISRCCHCRIVTKIVMSSLEIYYITLSTGGGIQNVQIVNLF